MILFAHLGKRNVQFKIGNIGCHFSFVMVLQQYEAVSFGDAVYGCYVLLPMQQQHATRLRSAVWSEHNAVISALIVPLQQVFWSSPNKICFFESLSS